jgi:hypothetical protein
MRLLVGDEPTNLPTLVESFNALSKKHPSPTNAVALAALGAVWEANDAAAAITAGLPENVANAYMKPLGVLARLRLIACGWENPGDKFKNADDTSWWQRPYKMPKVMWGTLGTYVDILAKSNVGGNWTFDENVANGDGWAISREVSNANADLQVIQAAKADVCLPFLPREKRGVLPTPNPACIARINAGKQMEKIKPALDAGLNIFGVTLPWWAWLALGYVAVQTLDKRRR